MVDESETDVVTKGAFAELCGVTPGRVSQWIGEGKIYAAALVGEGRKAKINVAVAREQLKNNLDIAQRLGNGICTRLDGSTDVPQAADEPAERSVQEPSAPKVVTIEDKLKAAKLEEAERRNRQGREDEMARVGIYMRTNDARAQMAKIAGSILNVIEGGMADIANTIAARFEIPSRDVQHVMRQEFRKVRAQAAESQRRLAGETEDLVEATQEEDVA